MDAFTLNGAVLNGDSSAQTPVIDPRDIVMSPRVTQKKAGTSEDHNP